MPMSSALIIAFATLLLAIVIAILIYDHRQTRLHRLQVRKLYASAAIEQMKPIFRFAKKHAVELATVDKTGVYFRFLSPGYGQYRFVMKDHGLAQLSPKQQSAMRTILEEQLPHLTEKTHYRLTRRTIHLLNGDIEFAYSYTMSNAYKEKLTRAPYYAPQMLPYSG